MATDNLSLTEISDDDVNWGDNDRANNVKIDASIANPNFGRDKANDSGLNFGLYSGRVRQGTTVSTYAGGTLALADDDINYIEVDPADGTVSANTTGFTAGSIPLYEVVTVSGAIDTVTDKRAFLEQPLITTLEDAPDAYTGEAGSQLQVNDGESALEFVHGSKNLVGYIGGELDLTSNDAEIKVRYILGAAFTAGLSKIAVDVAPVGADLIVDILKNGTSIFDTTPANRPTITDGSTSGTSGAPDTTSFAAGDVIEFQVVQVGSTTPGSRLSITQVMEAV